MAERADVIGRVIAFWFAGPGAPDFGQTRPIWFENDPAFDEEVRARFARAYERAAAGELNRLSATPEGCLALVILLDQFPRNMFRGTPKAFETDAKARQAHPRSIPACGSPRITPTQPSPVEGEGLSVVSQFGLILRSPVPVALLPARSRGFASAKAGRDARFAGSTEGTQKSLTFLGTR